MTDKPEIIKGARNAVSIAAAAAVVTTNPHLIAAAAIGTLAGDAVGYAERHFERKQQRLKARAEALSFEVLERLADVEEKLEIPEERVDLATEVFRKALEDDEDKKERYYGAILELILKDNIDVQTIKVLTSGVKMLAKIELDEFAFGTELFKHGLAFSLRLDKLISDGAPLRRDRYYFASLVNRLQNAAFLSVRIQDEGSWDDKPRMTYLVSEYGNRFLFAVNEIQRVEFKPKRAQIAKME